MFTKPQWMWNSGNKSLQVHLQIWHLMLHKNLQISLWFCSKFSYGCEVHQIWELVKFQVKCRDPAEQTRRAETVRTECFSRPMALCWDLRITRLKFSIEKTPSTRPLNQNNRHKKRHSWLSLVKKQIPSQTLLIVRILSKRQRETF